MCADEREYLEECERLQSVVDEFAAKMIGKLIDKAAEGYRGWDSPANRDMIRQKLLANVKRSDWVDVANLAAMLWNQEQSSYEGIRRLKAGPGAVWGE